MKLTLAPIVRSLLETDLYKFTMWQVMLHRHPQATAVYEFVCRNTPAFPLTELKLQLERELDHLCQLRFQPDELTYLGSLRFIKPDFVEFLRLFQFQRRFIQISEEAGQLRIRASGPQIHVMGFEIFVLYIVSELYMRRLLTPAAMAEGERQLQAVLTTLKSVPTLATPFEFFDFGLRRRASAAWQDHVVATLAREVPQYFKGTSNVYLAWKRGLVAIGTMAHEYLQSFQAYGGILRDFQKQALEDWVQEYRGDLGTALTDVITMDAFLQDFDLYFAKLFDGLRHDSGEPIPWGESAIAHYQKLKIPLTGKRLTFSDSLTVVKAIGLYAHFGDRIQTGAGIGTFLTNNLGITPLNLVMKLTQCNGKSVAKISDSPGKTLCKDEIFLAYLKNQFNVKASV